MSGTYNPGAAARDLQCYTYDYAGRLTNAWADKGDQTPSATTNLSSPTTATGGLGSCADSTSNNAPSSASALGGPAPYWQTYSFDTTGAAGLGNGALTGNRSSVTDHDITGNTANDVTSTSNYPAAGTANNAPATPPNGPPVTTGTGPHLLGSVTRSGGATGTDGFGYDGAGDTTSRTLAGGAKQTLTWDAEGRLSTVTDTSTTPATTATYVYGANGDQLIRRDAKGTTGTTTLYLGSTQIHLNVATGALSGERYYSYDSAPDIVASSSGALLYEVENNQGTGGTTINAANGHVVARRYTKPFGDSRGTPASTWPDDHTFLNKTTDASTGLVDMGARKYDPTSGRFLSVDPVFQPGDPQSLGGYAYAANDPATKSDPSGLTLGDMCHDEGGHMNAGVCVFGSSSNPTGNTTPTPQYTPFSFGFDKGHLFVVDGKGYAHAISFTPEKPGEKEMYTYLNMFLVAANGYCFFGWNDCTGIQYLYQNGDASRELNGVPKDQSNIPGAGLTADLIKLYWVNGHLAMVSTVDVYAPDSTSPARIRTEVDKKLKDQADSVVIYARSDAIAEAALGQARRDNVRLVQLPATAGNGMLTDTGAETEMLHLTVLRLVSRVVPKASGGGSSKPALPAPSQPSPTQLPPSKSSGGSGVCGGGNNTIAGGSCIPKDIWDGLFV